MIRRGFHVTSRVDHLYQNPHSRATRLFLHRRPVGRLAAGDANGVNEPGAVTGVDHYIADISNLVAENVGYTGTVEWDQSKTEGTPRKLLELRLLGSTGRSPSIDSASGIASTVERYRANGAAQRG